MDQRATQELKDGMGAAPLKAGGNAVKVLKSLAMTSSAARSVEVAM